MRGRSANGGHIPNGRRRLSREVELAASVSLQEAMVGGCREPSGGTDSAGLRLDGSAVESRNG